MTFNAYQLKAFETALYPRCGNKDLGPILSRLVYPIISLGGEVGELQNKIKKMMRDTKRDGSGVIISGANVADMARELGDILWYVSAICTELGIDFETVARMNIEKLQARASAGTIQGTGDNR